MEYYKVSENIDIIIDDSKLMSQIDSLNQKYEVTVKNYVEQPNWATEKKSYNGLHEWNNTKEQSIYVKWQTKQDALRDLHEEIQELLIEKNTIYDTISNLHKFKELQEENERLTVNLSICNEELQELQEDNDYP